MRGHVFRRLVVAAVIARSGRLLVAERRAGTDLAGTWEFPGGCVEPDETAERALERELVEELGVRVAVGAPVTFAWHRNGRGGEILLLFYRASILAGEPSGLEGQALRWVTAAELAELPTPPADAELVRQLVSGEIEL